MNAPDWASLVWGLVGALGFLVLVQSYRLLGGQLVSWPAILAVAAVVGATVTGLALVAAKRRT